MKKLLALILCVMMFVAIIPTAAFADNTVGPARPANAPVVTNLPLTTLNNSSLIAAQKAISHAKSNIEYLYGTLTANESVFETIKGVDGIVKSLVTDLFAGVDGEVFGIPASKLSDNTKIVMKDLVGSAMVNYLDDHFTDFAKVSTAYTVDTAAGAKLSFSGKTNPNGAYLYTDAAGNVYAASPNGRDARGNTIYNWQKTTAKLEDAVKTVGTWADAKVVATDTIEYNPIKYAQTFADAATDAFTSKKSAAEIENLMYQMYSAKLLDDVNDKLDDLRDDIRIWEDGNKVLQDYHFSEGLFFPYAFMDQFDTPNTIGEHVNPIIFAP